MPNELIPVRLSHLLGHSGVGAMVRGEQGVVVVQDTRHWTDRQDNLAGEPIPYVERVRVALGIEQELRAPPVAKKLANGQPDGVCVPALRFPTWMRCPACGALCRWPWRHDQPDQTPRCDNRKCKRQPKPKLEQVTWALAHPQGYLADVPWHWLAHQDQRQSEQRECKARDTLELVERRYEGRIVRCDTCKAENRFSGNEPMQFGQDRMQPWTKDDLVMPEEEGVAAGNAGKARVLAINDARVYQPVAVSALVIPPESRIRKGTVVDRLYRNSGDRSRIDGARTLLARKSALKTLANIYRCTTADIKDALADLENGYPLYGQQPTPGQLRESEFKSFLETLPDRREDEDLVTHDRSNEWHKLELEADLNADARHMVRAIHHLVRVDRLKEVKVFKGFTRLHAKEIVPPDISGQSGWLPAIELYGEGLFLALDEARLEAWEQTAAVAARLKPLLPRYAESGRADPNPLTARFVLLHTLSHLLMRQIESEGGYPAASLLERIYCSRAPKPMAAILIYVAVHDLAGSLGGLAELGEPRRFLGILLRALEHARWCSLDPVCSEHEGQGPELLNRAACHACALAPEPACEYGNILLDRGFIRGDEASSLPACFGVS